MKRTNQVTIHYESGAQGSTRVRWDDAESVTLHRNVYMGYSRRDLRWHAARFAIERLGATSVRHAKQGGAA